MTMSTDLKLTRVPTAKVGMLIRGPQEAVFSAFADPEQTTRFWFTRSSGPLREGATVRWEWEMYGVATEVAVRRLEEYGAITYDWGPDDAKTTVDMRFVPWQDDATYVQVEESGFRGSGDEVVAAALDSTGGFTMVLCAAKALLEHDIVLTVVADKAPPPGLEL
jgi:uncharacterized protein YndB with AHSA1/START domain